MIQHAILISIHILAATVWVGGMFFAWMVLRPSAVQCLEPQPRLQLWGTCFRRFFPWVWACVLLLPLSGYGMIFNTYDGLFTLPGYIHVMNLLGTVMIALFVYIYLSPYRALQQAISDDAWPIAADALARIRRIIGINLLLGLHIIGLAAASPFLG